jgi:hypothetical protein
MAGRTLADAQADYTAVHTAYLKALNAEEYSPDGTGKLRRSKSEELYRQLMILDAEVKHLSRGGFRVRGGTPV